MHLITHSRLRAFAETPPEAPAALDAWYRIMKQVKLTDFNELRRVFPSADLVGKCVVFNIGGNKIRRSAAIHYHRSRVYLRHLLTQAQYRKDQWKPECDK